MTACLFWKEASSESAWGADEKYDPTTGSGMTWFTARHAGHMDILRELIDGATGDHQRA